MFKLQKDPQFTHDVPVMVPVDDGHQEEMLRTRFRVLDDEALAEIDWESKDGAKVFLRAVIVRFEDVVDDHDKPILMSDELRERMIAKPYIRDGLTTAYGKALSKARLGN